MVPVNVQWRRFLRRFRVASGVETIVRQLTIGLAVPAVAVGCSSEPQSARYSQAASEPKASKSDKEAATSAYVDCVIREVREIDDGRSDARTIAMAVRSLCRSAYLRSINVQTQGESVAYKRAYYQEAQNGDLELATTAVLRGRSQRTSVGQPRAPAPSSGPAVRPPPPMIPPG